MGHKPPNITEELEFKLTHSNCNAAVVNMFYLIEHDTSYKKGDWLKLNKKDQLLLINLYPKGGIMKLALY